MAEGKILLNRDVSFFFALCSGHHRILVPLFCLLGSLAMNGCTQFGPRVVEASRTDYNTAMARTEGEQMLVNLVRLRYGDRPYFLEATALNTQFSIAPSAELSSSFDFKGNNLAIAQGRFAFEEKPTVTYTPLRGEEFVRRVLARISLDTLLLLDSSGWRLDRVLRVCVEKLNGLDNAARASGPTPADSPDTRSFRRALELLAVFERDEAFRTLRKANNDATRYVLRFTTQARQSAAFAEFVSLLGLDPALEEYALTFNEVVDRKRTINFETRSFMGVMYFLAHSVNVPEIDVARNRVRVTRNAAGAAFEWEDVMGGLLDIRSASGRPENVATAVNYRGSWFYLDDTDHDSKSTFALIGQLFALQSKGGLVGAPVLTLPVGG